MTENIEPFALFVSSPKLPLTAAGTDLLNKVARLAEMLQHGPFGRLIQHLEDAGEHPEAPLHDTIAQCIAEPTRGADLILERLSQDPTLERMAREALEDLGIPSAADGTYTLEQSVSVVLAVLEYRAQRLSRSSLARPVAVLDLELDDSDLEF